jgi:peptidoglycan biosynthesis protein MviN/MurJ (putative lipid II flippase)
LRLVFILYEVACSSFIKVIEGRTAKLEKTSAVLIVIAKGLLTVILILTLSVSFSAFLETSTSIPLAAISVILNLVRSDAVISTLSPTLKLYTPAFLSISICSVLLTINLADDNNPVNATLNVCVSTSSLPLVAPVAPG